MRKNNNFCIYLSVNKLYSLLMNSKIKKTIAAIGFAIVVISCSKALYIPTTEDAQRMKTSTDTLALGKNLYVNHCNSCHGLYNPERFTKEKWAKIIPPMQKKANIDNATTKLISQYIFARARVN